jgi:hypothetical protein
MRSDPVLLFSGHEDAIRCLVVHDNVLYTGSNDEQILAWDIDSQQPLRAFSGHSAPVSCLHCDEQESRTFIFSGSFDQSIRSWDVTTGQQVQAFFGHAVSLFSVQILFVTIRMYRGLFGAWMSGKGKFSSQAVQIILLVRGISKEVPQSAILMGTKGKFCAFRFRKGCFTQGLLITQLARGM